jgi:hypothetical protein
VIDVKCLVLQSISLRSQVFTPQTVLTEQDPHPQLEQSPEQEQEEQSLCYSSAVVHTRTLAIMVLALDPMQLSSMSRLEWYVPGRHGDGG